MVVSNLGEAVKTYRCVLGLEPTCMKEVKDQKVRVAIFKVGSSSIELLEPTDESSTVAGFLSKRGEGLHHIAFNVEDMGAVLRKAQDAGAIIINERRIGAEGQLVAFLHPKSMRGTLVELCAPNQESP